MNETGQDAEGQEQYSSPQALWDQVEQNKQQGWYGTAVSYWDRQEASYDGVLGGHADVSDVDVLESTRLLKRALGAQLQAAQAGSSKLTALDCGAGIGRVSEQLLLHFCQEVDLLEPSAHLLDTAKRRLTGSKAETAGKHPPGHAPASFFYVGLQDFQFTQRRYDIIWIQWALLYLTDDDAIGFFQRCRQGLTEDGIIFIKENICQTGFVVDKEDASLTRSNAYMLKLFARANMQVVLNVQQRQFPRDLFKVRMYVIRPSAA